MKNRSKSVVEIREILMQLRAGVSQRQIAQEKDIHRRTVKRYEKWAREQGLLEGELPSLDELHNLLQKTIPIKKAPHQVSSVEPYRAWVETRAIHQRLMEQGFEHSEMAVYRFVKRLKGNPIKATVRVERKPGEEAQVDFGYAGLMLDGHSDQPRRTWAFVMVLSWSRHLYVEFVFDQRVETWLKCHRNAFAYFGGVPERVVIDNLKAGIVKASRMNQRYKPATKNVPCIMGFGSLLVE